MISKYINEDFKKSLSKTSNNNSVIYEQIIYKTFQVVNNIYDELILNNNKYTDRDFKFYNEVFGYTILNYIKYFMSEQDKLVDTIKLTTIGLWNYNLLIEYKIFFKETKNITFPNSNNFFRLHQVILYIEKNLKKNIMKSNEYKEYLIHLSIFDKIYCKLTRGSEQDDSNVSDDEYEICCGQESINCEKYKNDLENIDAYIFDIKKYISNYQLSYINPDEKLENCILFSGWKYHLKKYECEFLKMSKYVKVTNYQFKKVYRFNIDSAKSIFNDIQINIIPIKEDINKKKIIKKPNNYYDILSE